MEWCNVTEKESWAGEGEGRGEQAEERELEGWKDWTMNVLLFW